MRVVVVGAGLGGLAAAAHLVGDGHDVTVVERGDRPGGRAGIVERDGFRLDNGPTVLTMPELLADTFAAAGAELADHVELRPVDPMYRAVLRRRLGAPRPPRPRGDDRGDPGVRRRRRGGVVRALRRLARPSCTGSRCRTSSTPTSTRRSTSCGAGGPGCASCGSAASASSAARWRRSSTTSGCSAIFGFQAMYAGVAPHEALALYSVITYMDTIDGVVVPVGGMHAMATGLADAVDQGRGDVPLRGAGDADPARRGRRGARRRARRRRAPRRRRRRVQRRPAGGLPHAARRRRRAPRRPPGPVLAVVPAVGGRRPWAAAAGGGPPQHPLRPAVGRVVRRDHPPRRADDRPVDPRHAALARRRRRWRPPGCSTLYALEPVPNLDGRVDWTRRRERSPRPACVSRWPRPGIRWTW